jgi:hypothetical protein
MIFGHPDLQTSRQLTSVGFLMERVYSKNLRSLEELKHIIEQTEAGIDP